MITTSTVQHRISRHRNSEAWTLTVSCMSVALVVAAMAALYTALPEIAVSTGATQTQLTWIVDGYTLVLACLVLPAGAIGDRYGRRAVLIGGLAIFAAASAIPLVASDPQWLIGARALAGAGAALVMPSTLSLLTAGFGAERRGRAVGVWAGVAGSGAVLGILGAGVLLEMWAWQSVFVGLTACGIALAALSLTLGESRDHDAPALDIPGAVTVAVAIAGIVFATIEVPERGWGDPLVLGAAGFGFLAAVLFVALEWHTDTPLLDVRLFLDRAFAAGAVSITVQFVVTFGVFMLLVQYLQLIFGYGPLTSALALTPMTIPLTLLSLVAPRIAQRIGLRIPMVSGLVIMSVGLFLVSRISVEANYVDVLWPLLVVSTGLGLCTAPATFAIVEQTPQDKQGVAAAVNDATREVGAAFGIAVAGSVLAAGYGRRLDPHLAQVPEQLRAPVSDSLAAALEAASQAGPAAEPIAQAAREAFVYGGGQASLSLAGITVLAAVALALLAPGRPDKN